MIANFTKTVIIIILFLFTKRTYTPIIMADHTALTPTSRWLKRIPLVAFHVALVMLSTIADVPPDRPDIHVPDDDDVAATMAVLMRALEEKKKLRFPLSDCELLAIMCYTLEDGSTPG